MNHLEPTPNPIVIVGCGPGAREDVTPRALTAILHAEVLVGARRLLDLFPEAPGERVTVSANIDAALDAIASALPAHRIAVLVTGDPGVRSLARPVLRRFGLPACEVIPGISSVQVAFARVGVDWYDAKIISAHGSLPALDPSTLAAETKIAILAGDAAALRWAADLADTLKENDHGPARRIFIAEDLTLPEERVREVTREELRTAHVSPRAIIMIFKSEVLE